MKIKSKKIVLIRMKARRMKMIHLKNQNLINNQDLQKNILIIGNFNKIHLIFKTI